MASHERSKFYISTAINYTNGSPHFGHAYEAVVADCIARYHRLSKDVFFLTGTDEHGQKVADTAAAQNPPIPPIALCDKYVAEFQSINKALSVSNDFYIRTTSPQHEALAQLIWQRAAEAGDIYLGKYEGWYSKREEKFLTEMEAKALNYLDGDKPLIKTSEPSYFFKMSRYQDRLIAHINENPDFIFPPEKRNDLLERLKEPLLDLSVSRTTFDWGIPIPETFKGKGENVAEKHVMYVWFDALTNYLTGVDWPNGPRAKYWPANVHLIGKDISWFHAVIWPCILFSANIELPKQIVCHGFVNGPDGRKMSKSWGNVVDPVAMVKKYENSDIIRYFMLREGSFGADFNFNEDSLRDRHDTELGANLGNLAARALTLVGNYSEGKVPAEAPTQIFSVEKLFTELEAQFSAFQIQTAALTTFNELANVNKWLADEAPWHLKGDENAAKRRSIVRTLLESLYILAHFVAPFLPRTAEILFERLGKKPILIPELIASAWSHLTPGAQVTSGDNLFPRLGENRFQKKQHATEKGAPEKPADKKGGKGQVQKKAAPTNTAMDISRIDLRVGKIVKVVNHPQADHLYIEDIDLGEEKPRQVVSGLAKFIPIEEMQDRMIVVVCNMKPANFRGVRSEAMVLAANSDDGSKVELVAPPPGAAPGTRLFVEGFPGEPDEELNPKQKVFETIKPDLKTNGEKVACFRGVPIQSAEGVCTAASLSNCQLG